MTNYDRSHPGGVFGHPGGEFTTFMTTFGHSETCDLSHITFLPIKTENTSIRQPVHSVPGGTDSGESVTRRFRNRS